MYKAAVIYVNTEITIKAICILHHILKILERAGGGDENVVEEIGYLSRRTPQRLSSDWFGKVASSFKWKSGSSLLSGIIVLIRSLTQKFLKIHPEGH
mmetsp:Transcript_651/g.1510  ORF Transcript_651/g.1510 Transcript_651/m.1510 type:complete len:97 (+) Transcript_651:1295-1585(+)